MTLDSGSRADDEPGDDIEQALARQADALAAVQVSKSEITANLNE